MEKNIYFIISDVNNIYGKKYVGKSGNVLIENPNMLWMEVENEKVLVDKKDIIPFNVYRQTLKTIEDVMRQNNMSQKKAVEVLIEAYTEGIRVLNGFLY